MRNTLTFSSIINILIDNKKNTYPQYLLVADLFGLDLGIDFYAGETLGVADSNTIRISNWCTGKRPIPLDIVQENDADNFESMAERFSENICPNILNITHARSETEKIIKENVMVLGEEMADAMTLIEDNCDFFTSVIRYAISNSHSQGTFFSPDLADTLLNCHTPRPVMTFTRRDTEAKEAYKMLSKEPVLFVSGIAGIGKSEFSKYFAEKYEKKYTNIIYWFYSGNLKRNITEMGFTSDRMDMTDAQRFHAHLQYLKNLKKDSLIIIDNFNVLPKEDPMLKELIQYDFSILVTTRCKVTAFPVFEIKELDTENELLPLFGNICPYENEETDTIHNIIDTVHAHTLTVCLSALSMLASGISPSDLLDELKSCGTDIASGEDVELYKDGEFSDGLMIEHLKKLLRITNLTEEQQYILCNLSLMPVSGIWKNPFGKWLRLGSLTEINRLIKYGFISEDNERRTIALHPLIREISEKETQPTISSCINLWDYLHAVIIVHGLDVSRPSVVINTIDSMINHIIIDNNEEYLLFLQDLFPYYQKYKADELMHKLVERIEYIMNEFHIAAPCDRALLLDYKAELLLEDDKPEKALKKRKRAVEIMEKEYSQNTDQRTVNLLSNLYNNLANTYFALSKENDAITALEKALFIRIEHREMNLIVTHDLLQQMMNVTRFKIEQNRTDEAEKILAYYETIVTERLGKDSMDFGICIFTRGIISFAQLNYTEAEQFFLEAERIFQNKMPQSSDYLGNVRQYLYTLYMKQGRYSLANVYNTKISNTIISN